jgi:hypothetical protein
MRNRKDFGTADVGDWVRENFGVKENPNSKRAEHNRSKQDLRRLPEARDFRRDNPDADLEDYTQWQKSGGRYQGKVDK